MTSTFTLSVILSRRRQQTLEFSVRQMRNALSRALMYSHRDLQLVPQCSRSTMIAVITILHLLTSFPHESKEIRLPWNVIMGIKET